MIEGHEPNPALQYVVSFSGGKDSVATWLLLTRELKLPNVTCIFANTGHESPITYQYIDDLERDHGLPIVRLQPTLEDFRGELVEEKIRERLNIEPDVDVWTQPLDMERLAILKRRFPSTMVRFCTIHLKQRCCARWLNANREAETTIITTGVRAEESAARAKRSTWCQDEYSGCMMWMPIHKWTHEQVFEQHRKHGVAPNPLYLAGMSRVGCWPCIMAKKCELAAIARRFPECFDHLRAMEKRVAAATGKPQSSFFSNYKTPDRFHSQADKNQKSFPTADDVRLWALGEEPASSDQVMLAFEDDWTEDAHACISQYGLCE